MPENLRRILIVALPVTFVFALALNLYVWSGSGDALIGRVVSTGTATIGGPFTLTDQDGRTRSSKEFAGRYMLVYFGYAQCPDVCPTTLAFMTDALRKVGPQSKQIVPIFITIDPERDTSKTLKPYVRSFDPGLIGLTGDLATIKKVAAAYKVYFKKQPTGGNNYGMDHSNAIYLMGRDGRYIAYWDDTAIGPDKLAAEIREKL